MQGDFPAPRFRLGSLFGFRVLPLSRILAWRARVSYLTVTTQTPGRCQIHAGELGLVHFSSERRHCSKHDRIPFAMGKKRRATAYHYGEALVRR